MIARPAAGGARDVESQAVTGERNEGRRRRAGGSDRPEGRRAKRCPSLRAGPKKFNGTVVVWVDPDGKASLLKDGKLVARPQAVLDRRRAILALDVFGTGELAMERAGRRSTRTTPATPSATTGRCWPTGCTTS